MGWRVEFFEDHQGRQAAGESVRVPCTPRRERDAGESSPGKPTAVLLRMFCHAYGERIVLLLGGYDKGAAPSKKRQDTEIETARRRLRSFQLRLQRERAERRRG